MGKITVPCESCKAEHVYDPKDAVFLYPFDRNTCIGRGKIDGIYLCHDHAEAYENANILITPLASFYRQHRGVGRYAL